jgi:site-specific recombinase XerD
MVFYDALDRSGVHKRVSVLSLRHSFQTVLLENGISLPKIV